MKDERWELVKHIFQEVLDRPESERSRYLGTACGDDAELRAKVDALLSAHREADVFLASPTLGDAGEALDVGGADGRGATEAAGTRIGPYKLLQLIGEGGFGSVYMAEQEEPIRRRVALKIIKLGMDTKEVVARFEAERQALAMMEHPNIARVLDAGTTEQGRPYFVMELVKGVPITEYCDAARLSTRERLRLFVDVCKAVEHAHAKGVIHRDLKPSNVMVTLHDGTPVPKVIDFGVAKAMNHRLTEKTLFTAYGEFIGTPTYMSPEQAEMSGLEVDRRSDVYSLGVLLYELLTGTTPFAEGALRAAALVEMLRILREVDPPTPSARLNTLGDRLGEVAQRRQVGPTVLAKLLRGDLDWIVMKAMEKDRRRRYDTAAALASDLERYFNDEPVVARRPGRVYRLHKFAKRQRGPLAVVASLVALVLLGGSLAQVGVFAQDGSGQESPPSRRFIGSEGSPTRDGLHLLRYDEDRRGYDLVEIETGQVRQLTSAGPGPEQRYSTSHDLAPDGKQIAAVHLALGDPDEASEPGNNLVPELRLFTVGTDGEGKLLRAWDSGHNVQVFGWTPDQARVWIFIIRPDLAAEIASVDLADGSIEVLKTLVWRVYAQPPSLSPDGRFMAYHDSDTRDARADIFVLATDGSREERIRQPGREVKPLFAPDGSGVVYRSHRPGGDLWFVPITDGRPTGEPRPVWADLNTYGTALVFAENGSLFHSVTAGGWEVYTAEVELASGVVGQPERVLPRLGERNNATAFSPDGLYMAHLRNGGRRLVLRELSTGNEREFPVENRLAAPMIDFCSDGRTVLVQGFQNEPAVFRVDIEHGGAERLPIAEAVRAVCVDGGHGVVYLQGPDPNGITHAFHRSLASGAETRLYEGPGHPYHLARSPDGSQVAFLGVSGSDAQLLVQPVAGGPAVAVASSPKEAMWTEFHGIMWMPDGQELLVARAPIEHTREQASPEVTLWRLPLDGSPAAEVGRLRLPSYENAWAGSSNYSLHPEGTRIAFERHAGQVQQTWAIDNLMEFIQSGGTAPAAAQR